MKMKENNRGLPIIQHHLIQFLFIKRPHSSFKTNTEKLETLQYRGLNISFGSFESSLEKLLSRVNLTTFHLGRLKTIALETLLPLLTSE